MVELKEYVHQFAQEVAVESFPPIHAVGAPSSAGAEGDVILALEKLGFLLKRTGRRAEAVPLWEQWASFTVEEALPCVELSKYYEWQAQDTALALRLAERAQAVVLSPPPTWPRGDVMRAVTRRRASRRE